METIISHNLGETRQLAKDIAFKIASHDALHATVVAFYGDLGAGKTTFIQALCRALGVREIVKSPTFTIMKIYQARKRRIFHLDCYRLIEGKDLQVLGISEIISDPNNIVLIEWANKVKNILPKKHIKLFLEHIAENERKIDIYDS